MRLPPNDIAPHLGLMDMPMAWARATPRQRRGLAEGWWRILQATVKDARNRQEHRRRVIELGVPGWVFDAFDPWLPERDQPR